MLTLQKKPVVKVATEMTISSVRRSNEQDIEYVSVNLHPLFRSSNKLTSNNVSLLLLSESADHFAYSLHISSVGNSSPDGYGILASVKEAIKRNMISWFKATHNRNLLVTDHPLRIRRPTDSILDAFDDPCISIEIPDGLVIMASAFLSPDLELQISFVVKSCRRLYSNVKVFVPLLGKWIPFNFVTTYTGNVAVGKFPISEPVSNSNLMIRF